MCLINVELYLHENVVFSVCVHMGNAAYILFNMWNSISGLDAWYNILFKINCGVAVRVRGHQKKNQVIFKGGEGKGVGPKNLDGRAIFCGRLNFSGRLHFWGRLPF